MAVQRSYVITRPTQLKAVYKHARATCNTEMKLAMNGALDNAVYAAKLLAPVYDQAKWASWYNMEHHYSPPPGTLKNSIFHSPASSFARGAEYRSRYGSLVKYSSYIEKGFKHKRATDSIPYTVISGKKRKEKTRYKAERKFIPGKHFMESSLDLVFWPSVEMKFKRAVERMLQTPAVGA